MVSEQSTGFPGYDSIITRDKATIGRILKDNGYRTSWFGKDHNVPSFQSSQDGPFDQWPIGMGFEYFYGFIGGDSSQWQPNLFRYTTQIYPFEGKPPGTWNLVTAMADDAIAYMSRINALNPVPSDTPMVPEVSGFDRKALIPAAVMAPPIVWLCSLGADAVTGSRYIAAHWEASLQPEEAERRCRAPIAWPDLAQTPVWPGARPAAWG